MNDQTTATGVERIREAAALMRRNVAEIGQREDRWAYLEGGDGPYVGHVHFEGDPQWSGVADVIVGAGPHIASWDPTVALAVADLLDSLADYYDYHGLEPMPKPLAIADAYLGTTPAEAVAA